MIIDAHGHAAGDYVTAESIIATTQKYEIDKVILGTSPKNNLGLKAPPNHPLMKSPSSIYLLNRMLRVVYKFFRDSGLVFLFALFFWPARALIQRMRRKTTPVEAVTVSPARNLWLVWASVLAALASLFSLLCLTIIARIPNLVYVPCPHPYSDLAGWQFALLRLPFASLLLAIGIALMMVLAIKSGVGARVRWYYITVGLALLAFNLAIIL